LKKLAVRKEDLKYNLNLIRNHLSGKAGIIAVVKANGMGLDIVQYAQFLMEEGIEFFGVANTSEAIALRQNGIYKTILMLSEVIQPEEIEQLITNHVVLTVGTLEEKQKIEEIARRLNQQVRIHIKIDTGFARFGFLYSDEKILEAAQNTEYITVTGCFTHFSKPMDEKWTRLQFSRFQENVDRIKEVNPEIKFHCCGSTAFLKYEDMWLDFVRLGSCMQGRVLQNTLGFRKVGWLQTEIITIRDIEKGYNISYSNEFKAPKDMKIAVIGVRLYGWLQLEKS